MPVENSVALVALVGTIAASLLEYITGFAMESLFHVRYWDYSKQPLNLHGYIWRAVCGDVGGVLRADCQRGQSAGQAVCVQDSA